MTIPANASKTTVRLEQLFERVRVNIDFLLTIDVSHRVDRARAMMALMSEGMSYLDYIAGLEPRSIMPSHLEVATILTAADSFCDSVEKYKARNEMA